MRFGIWTFLDILKMSIFEFLEEMFFYRTEKSGKKIFFIRRIQNGKEIIKNKNVFFIIFSKPTLEKWTFLNVVVVDTGT